MVQGFGIRRPNRPMSYWEGELTLFCITSSSFIPRWIFVLIGHALSSDQRSDRIFPSWGRGASTHVSIFSITFVHTLFTAAVMCGYGSYLHRTRKHLLHGRNSSLINGTRSPNLGSITSAVKYIKYIKYKVYKV